ncbi:MAG: phosphate acetyltransferase [Rhizobiaceae bacterium]
MMNSIIESARGSDMCIVLAEGEDERVQDAARRAADDGLAHLILLGGNTGRGSGVNDLSGIELADIAHSPLKTGFAETFLELRKHRGVTEQVAQTAMDNPLNFAAMMVRTGHADGMVGGAVATTADTVRAAIQIIGKADSAKLVSSFFLMGLSGAHLPHEGLAIFADCGLVVDPDAEALSEIAIASAENYFALTGEQPRVAMLSFSTKGSAKHPTVDKMIDATRLVRTKSPDLIVDGELQFDAAFVPPVAAAKAPGSAVGGEANVFIFPDLNAGNIAYKIAQRIGGAQAIGPVLQGLAKPANDLSRGCSSDDIYNMIALTAVQAKRASD